MAPLRLAHVLYDGAEVLAVEYRGRLLSVAELERLFELETSPQRFAEVSSFRRRVFSLGLAGLEELVDCLADGEAPPSAVLDPSQCLWMVPTLANPALLLFEPRPGATPSFRRGFGRCLLGHEAPLPVPSDETAPRLEAGIAAILGDDLRCATPEQAERAIIGYAPISLWTFPSREALSPGWGSFRLGQLGPMLTASHDRFDPSDCEVSLVVNGHEVATSQRAPWRASFGEMIAFASEGADLFAGDVVACGPLAVAGGEGRAVLRDRDRVSVRVAGLGELAGVVVASAPRKGAHCWAPVS